MSEHVFSGEVLVLYSLALEPPPLALPEHRLLKDVPLCTVKAHPLNLSQLSSAELASPGVNCGICTTASFPWNSFLWLWWLLDLLWLFGDFIG